MPLTLAWEVFGEKNGASTYEEFHNLVFPLASKTKQNLDIGCTVLANPFFLEENDWIGDPPGWAGNIVRGKMYETTSSEGNSIWRGVNQHFCDSTPTDPKTSITGGNYRTSESMDKYGDPVLIKPRIGQASFRMLVTEAYKRKCAITGESTLVALEAAHIVPYSQEGTHDVQNGLLLRADFHRLFDVGLVSVTQDYRIRVNPKIRENWLNGKVYYRLDNTPLSVLPEKEVFRPTRDKLNWHFQNVFQA